MQFLGSVKMRCPYRNIQENSWKKKKSLSFKVIQKRFNCFFFKEYHQEN